MIITQTGNPNNVDHRNLKADSDNHKSDTKHDKIARTFVISLFPTIRLEIYEYLCLFFE